MCWVACLAYRARAALSERARAEGVRGLWTLTIWPLGGWFPHWLPLFLANNWDLIWPGGGVNKTPVTPLLQLHRTASWALKESSLWSVLLCEGWGPATRPFFFFTLETLDGHWDDCQLAVRRKKLVLQICQTFSYLPVHGRFEWISRAVIWVIFS